MKSYNMEMRVLCAVLLGVVLADNPAELNTPEKAEISTAESSTEIHITTEPTETETQCHKSLFSKEDLRHIIDYLADSLSIGQSINNTIHSIAVPVLKKHVERISFSMNWFSQRPEHLKHVLEDISVTRQDLEKTVVGIRKSLAKYPDFVPLYQEKVERVTAILKKMVYFKQLCDFNCGATEVEFRSASTGSTSDRYCGSIAEINKTTHERLQKFANKHKMQIHQRVIQADKSYNEKAQTKINDLKNVALKEFGNTMYQILNLQDNYHHIKKDLKEFNNDYWLVTLRNLNAQIDGLLLRLDNVVNNFGNYCKKCNRIYRSAEPVEYRQNVDGLEKDNLLDSIINNKIAEISNNTDAELRNIFGGLDENLDKSIMDNIFIEHLKPIQKEVTELIEKEFEAFKELQISKLSIDMDLVKKLIANTTDLVNAIAREYQAIVAIVKDLIP